MALKPERITILLFDACNDVSKDKCYGDEINKVFTQYYWEDCFNQPVFVKSEFFLTIVKLCYHTQNIKRSFTGTFFKSLCKMPWNIFHGCPLMIQHFY